MLAAFRYRALEANRMLRPVLLIALLALCLCVAAGPARAIAIQTEADFAILIDAETGLTLYEKKADMPMAPASMSKLMTTAIIFEELKEGTYSLDDTFPVSEKAWRMGGSKMFTEVDTRIAIRDLLRGIIVQSGNDACIVIAEGLAGSEEAFAELMNRRARAIGLTQSTFRNATGWPHPEHRMSARDLATLARYITEEFPEYFPIYAETEFTWSGIRQPNRNPLLGTMQGADGLKTGHTEDSGYGLVGTAERDGRRLIVVVNGLPSEAARAREARRLLEIGFREFDTYPLFVAGEIVAEAEVWGGVNPRVPLHVRDDITVILSHEARQELKVVARFDAPMPAPVEPGAQVGTLTVSAPGMTPADYPLVASVGVAKSGFLQRAGDGLYHLIREAVGG